MRIHSIFASAIVSFLALIVAHPASGQIVFQDNFDNGLSDANWTVNKSGGDSDANFSYNYAQIGIPAAPRSNGTTIGLRFLVNQGFDPLTTDGVFQGISASPTDKHFTDDFEIRFDMWLNYVGPLPAGGSGSTQMASFGWGTSGLSTQWAGAKNSVMFAGSGDGGTTQDYRAYLSNLAPAAGAPILPSTGVYAAGMTDLPAASDSRQSSDPYYARFGNVTAPAAQLALYPNQSGNSSVGTLGMAWHDMRVTKAGTDVSWFVDGLLIAKVPVGDAVFGGDNIFFGMFDINATASNDPNDFLNAAIFDNINVQVIPEPASVWMLAVAACAVSGARRRRRGV